MKKKTTTLTSRHQALTVLNNRRHEPKLIKFYLNRTSVYISERGMIRQATSAHIEVQAKKEENPSIPAQHTWSVVNTYTEEHVQTKWKNIDMLPGNLTRSLFKDKNGYQKLL